MFYRRRLPHLYQADQPVFLTWHLHGSLPPNRSFPAAGVSSGKAFAALDRLLDESRTGPFYLRRPMIADMVVEMIHHNADALGRYTLHAFVVMPNHVHMLVSPNIRFPSSPKPLRGLPRSGRTKCWRVRETLSGKRKAMTIWCEIERSGSVSSSISKKIQYARGW